MIIHEVLILDEQKFVGIKTIIPFKEADKIDFSKLHKVTCEARINNINYHEHFMAMDSDFTDESFSYTPLVPVSSFDDNEEYTHFTRRQGAYCAFTVNAKDLNPAWFKKVFEYLKENNICVENTGYDLEYYDEDYLTMVDNKDVPKERVLKILLKVQS